MRQQVAKGDIYQHQMHRYLILDKLDLPPSPQGYLAAELYKEVVAQGFTLQFLEYFRSIFKFQ